MHHLGHSVDASIEVAASASKLWDCWTQPDLLNSWYTVRSAGTPEHGAIYTWGFDPFFGPDQVLRVQELTDQKAILFSLGSMLLAIRFVQLKARARCDLIHAGFPDAPEMIAGCRSGWCMALGLLKFSVETYPDLSRQELLVLRKLPDAAPGVYEAMADPRQRRSWLALNDPPREVLVDTGRELLIRWDAIGGALELKQFEWGGAYYLCLKASSWSREYDLQTQRQPMGESLERLSHLAGRLVS